MEANQEEDRQREEPQTEIENSRDISTALQMLRFATFEPENTSAVHLLETVKITATPDQYLSHCLVSDEERLLYLLTLDPVAGEGAAPVLSRQGTWRIGAGPTAALREKGVPCCEVDILICPPGRSAGSRIARGSIGSVHAILQIQASSGALLLRSVCKKPIIYMSGCTDGRDLTLNGGESCLLFHPDNRLRFGDYEFSLSFRLDSAEDRDNFRAQRNRLLLRNYGQWPSQHLDLVPSPDHRICSDVIIHRTLSQNPMRNTYSGIRLHTGEPVLLKEIRCNAATQRWVRNELRVAAMFDPSADSGVLGIFGKAWCEHGMSPPCQIESKAPAENVFYTTQLVEYHFSSMPWSKVGMGLDVRLDYFYQTLKGLGELHQKGLIHGRLRPEALVLVSKQESMEEGDRNPILPPSSSNITLPACSTMSAAISDLEWVKEGLRRESKPNNVGAWVAPEVWTSSAEAPYTNKADIWGLAISWLPTYVQIPADIKMTRANFKRIQATVKSILMKGHITKPFCNLLLSMLAWDPEERPSVADILSNEVWLDFRRKRS